MADIVAALDLARRLRQHAKESPLLGYTSLMLQAADEIEEFASKQQVVVPAQMETRAA